MNEQEQIEEMDALIRVLRQQLVSAVEAASNASARVIVLQQRLDKAMKELENKKMIQQVIINSPRNSGLGTRGHLSKQQRERGQDFAIVFICCCPRQVDPGGLHHEYSLMPPPHYRIFADYSPVALSLNRNSP